MKTCNKCNIKKPASDFYKTSKKRPGGSVYRAGTCKVCRLAQMQDRKWKLHTQKLDYIRDGVGLNCSECGYDYCISALEFHHIDPSTKEQGVSDLLNGSYTLARFIKEAEKCVILCANCHREYHAGLRELTR